MGYPRIGNIQLDGFALLAPMAGVSDLAYRVIVRKMGAALTTAEMVSAKGLYLSSFLAVIPLLWRLGRK